MHNITSNQRANVYVRVFKRWWWLPVLFALLSAGVTYAGTRALMKPEYGASATLQVIPLAGGQVQNGLMDAGSVATVMTSSTVEQKAISNLPSNPKGPPASDPGAITRTACAPDASDRFVTCSTQSRDYLAAISAMNTLVSTYLAYNNSQSQKIYSQQLKGYNTQINLLQKEIHQLQLEQARTGISQEYSIANLQSDQNSFKGQKLQVETQVTNVEGQIRETSRPPNFPVQVSPHPLRNAILGLVVGIGISAALIVLLEYLDDTFRSSDEIAESTGLTVLGAVRKYEGASDEMGMVAARMPRTAIAEAYRVARANIQFTGVSGNLRVLVVTSARDGEGKTTTANNLATTFALVGQRVLLIDADLRRPGLTKMMALKDQEGLSTVLGNPTLDVIKSSEVVGLSVVPSGPIPPNPAELLGSGRMRAWIEGAAVNYDLIVLDTPPVLSVADTRILATLADGVVLVLDPSITTRRMVKQARAAVENVGGRILGVILNRDVMRSEGYYYNYYYYDKASVDDRERTSARR